MPKKTTKKTIKPYSYVIKKGKHKGQVRRVKKPFSRTYHVKTLTKEQKEKMDKGKVKPLYPATISKRTLPREKRLHGILYEAGKYIRAKEKESLSETYLIYLIRDFGFDKPELVIHELKKQHLLEETEGNRYKTTYIGDIKATRYKYSFNDWTLSELKEYSKWLALKPKRPERGYFHKDELVKAIERASPYYAVDQFEREKYEVNRLTDDEKMLLLYLDAFGSQDVGTLRALMGDYKPIDSLHKTTLATLTPKGVMHLRAHNIIDSFDAFKNVALTDFKLPIERELPHAVIEAARSLAANEEGREYSVAIDFEREEVSPERIVAMKGAKSFTYKIDDFELFGHTHPSHEKALPSKIDIINMKYGVPEIIVAGKSGDTIVLSIKDLKQFNKLKKKPENFSYYMYNYMDFENPVHKKDFLKMTGVEVRPYEKGMKIRMIDDLKREKSVPDLNKTALSNITKNIREYEE